MSFSGSVSAHPAVLIWQALLNSRSGPTSAPKSVKTLKRVSAETPRQELDKEIVKVIYGKQPINHWFQIFGTTHDFIIFQVNDSGIIRFIRIERFDHDDEYTPYADLSAALQGGWVEKEFLTIQEFPLIATHAMLLRMTKIPYYWAAKSCYWFADIIYKKVERADKLIDLDFDDPLTKGRTRDAQIEWITNIRCLLSVPDW